MSDPAMQSEDRRMSFTVLVDTNIIFTKGCTNVAPKSFEDAWSNCCKLGEMRLLIPATVRGERLYQLVVAAEEGLRGCGKPIAAAYRLLDQDCPKLPNREQLKAGATKRFAEWSKKYAATIAEVPYAKIDWPKVSEDAIWRNSPFVEPALDEDSEKGFRDVLILETVRDLVDSRKGEKFAFICGDRILRSAVSDGADVKRLSCYDSLEAFHSFLKFKSEEVEEKLSDILMKEAPPFFYSPTNRECLFNRFSIKELIIEKFATSLSIDGSSEPSPALGSFAEIQKLVAQNQPIMMTFPRFVAVDDEQVSVNRTDYTGKNAAGRYEWTSQLQFVRLFKQTGLPTTLSGFGMPETRLRTAYFDVKWSVAVDAVGKFSEPKLERIDKTANPIWISGYSLYPEISGIVGTPGTAIFNPHGGITGNSPRISGSTLTSPLFSKW